MMVSKGGRFLFFTPWHCGFVVLCRSVQDNENKARMYDVLYNISDSIEIGCRSLRVADHHHDLCASDHL